jgi:micrococcal nuclease
MTTHAALLFALLCLVVACASPDATGADPSAPPAPDAAAPPHDRQPLRVSRVIDGDTVVMTTGERVRYLMIDTPELRYQQCYADEATEFNRGLVEGREVELTLDLEHKDRFGRTLAYVFVDGREVNTLLVERGYACLLHIPPNGGDRLDEFRAREQLARRRRRGMWGACAQVACD